MTRVAIYGLSANPPTGLGGHQGIVRYIASSEFQASYQLQIDEIWILPVYTHIFSTKKSQLISFEDRFKMCQLCFERESLVSTSVQVVRYEEQLVNELCSIHGHDHRVGSVDILENLTQLFPENTFHMILGTDTFNDLVLGKWKNGPRLAELVSSFFVIQRGDAEIDVTSPSIAPFMTLFSKLVQGNSQKAIFIRIPGITDVSSTWLRTNRPWLSGEACDQLSIHPDVAQYIRDNGLY